ncbi:hypothetical protein WG68_13845 [Arsukibacterium ikkense]|uniref:Uncharacterized protein n=1 Tax=Arsukibacterium ikkense TaxID=336831 RepID=A0A0M2V216_9GAMM|nr:hypothetical protein [Arsukibacterium ikkense]KKO44902.1 hypothetical protein WG68_13845 [Arsukibacterium ikkense]
MSNHQTMRICSALFLSVLLLGCLLVSPEAQSTELQERLRLAAENYEQVITEQLASPGQRSYPDWLVLAQAYLSANNKDAALAALQQAGTHASSNLQQAQVALLTAKVYGILFRDTRHAISYLQQAEQLLGSSDNFAARQLYSEILTNFAQAHNQLGDLTQARHFASQSLTLALELEDPVKELAARIMLGRLALQNNHFQHAYNQLQQALVLADKLGDTEARASIHFRLGMAFRKIDEHTLALDHMQHAAALYQRLKNLSSYSYVLVYIAETYLEDPEGINQAEQHLLDALAISQQIDDVMRTAIIKQSLGRASRLRGDSSQAAHYYSEALQQFRQIGAQTYVQESALALAELSMLQQQFQQSRQIIAELSPGMDKAANYLQARYFSLSAQLAEQKQDWQQAYQLNQNASKLQFAELTATTTEKLKVLKGNLSLSNTQHDNHAQLLARQTALSEQLRYWQLAAGLFMLLAAVAAGLIIWQRRRHRQLESVRMAFLLSRSWSRFCERLQQDNRHKQPLQLIAIALTDSLKLKLNQGEETLRQPVQALMQKLTMPELSACCINSDVLWLGFRTSSEQATHYSQQLAADIRQALAPLQADSQLISLQLDVGQLLGARWQAHDLTALREALWLSWKLASLADDSLHYWQLHLRSEQPRPCEWHSSNIRLDMINAMQLGVLVLTLNQQTLPADLSVQLVADFGETRQP